MDASAGRMSNGCNEEQNQGGSPDDFELLPEANFEAMLSSLLHVNGAQAGISSIAGNGTMNEEMTSFVVLNHIRKEHKLLKDELYSQSALLREKIEACEERDRRRTQEISLLKNELDAAKLTLSEKEIREVELERQISYFRESSEKVDVMATRLMESDDLIKHQNSIIQQFQNDGFVNIQPPMLTDQLLAKELEQKEQRIKRLETALANVESDSLKAQEENRELRETVSELRGLATALQSQAELDKGEWAITRDEMAQQINDLVTRLSLLDPEFVAMQPQHTMAARRDEALTQATMVETTQTCPRCQLTVVNGRTHPCPGVIDGLD